MNKKGFTLVELLAVIAILALLVIIALPNVLSMFNSAKKDIFLTQAKSIYKEVSKKYISETMKGNKITKISSNGTKLDMDSNDLTYNISLDDKGNIKNFQVSDGTYCLSGKYNNLGELTTDKITEGKCENTEKNNIAGTLSKEYYNLSNIDSKYLVNSVTFYSDGRTIESNNKYDVSVEKNGKVLMYILETGNEIWYTKGKSSTFDIIIVGNGKVALPEDSSNLFSFYYAPTHGPESSFSKIEFNDSVDTSNVTNMRCMFCLNRVESYNLTGFDTSNVINMSSMFEVYGFNTPIEFNLSSFDTSKVIDMQYMFRKVVTNSLDLSSFDINDNANISNIFSESKINHGYAKDEKTASRLNTLLNKNVFVVK